jgi:hypothetical protein
VLSTLAARYVRIGDVSSMLYMHRDDVRGTMRLRDRRHAVESAPHAAAFVADIARGDFAATLQGLDAGEDGPRWKRAELESAVRASLREGGAASPSA